MKYVIRICDYIKLEYGGLEMPEVVGFTISVISWDWFSI